MTSPHDPDRPSGHDPQQGQYPPYPGQGSSGQDPYGGHAAPQYGGQPYGDQPPGYGQGGYPGYPGYAGGGYAMPPEQLPKGMAIAALVLGILGFLGSFFAVGLVLGIIAVIVGIVAVRRVSKGTASGRGMAVTGIVLGALSIVIGVIAAIVIGFFVSTLSETVQECQGLQGQEFQQCVQENLPGQQGLGLGAEAALIER